MATEKEKMNKDMNDLQDQLFASNFGLSRKFIDKNQEQVFKSNKAVNDVLTGFGVNNMKTNANSLNDLSRIVSRSIKFTDKYRTDSNGTVDETGIKTITPMGNIDHSEEEIINQASKMYQSFLNTCPEYRGIVNIIPEVKRAINNIVRDIMNVSELTGKCFNDVYDSDGLDSYSLDEDQRENIKRNSDKIKEIIENNDLEDKNKRWIFESLVCGVKPVAFIPYKHIIKEIEQINSEYDIKLTDSNANQRVLSGEGGSPIKTDARTQKRFEQFAVESSMEDVMRANRNENSVESVETKTDEEFDDILDDLVEDYGKACESLFNENYNKFNTIKGRMDSNQDAIFSTESNSSGTPNEELIDKVSRSFKETKEQYATMKAEDKKEKAKKGLRVLANWIDENIKVVKPEFTTSYIANKKFKQKDRYSKFYNLGKDYKMAEGINNTMNAAGSKKSEDNPDYGFDTTSTLAKECLIVPYAPEAVIPININGEYLGFYALEYDNIVGPSYGKRRRCGSFTDYVQQQGFGDDSSFISGAGMPAMAYGGADPLENSLYSPASLYNYSASQYMHGGTDQEDEKFDILKTVVLRVLSHRLRDPDLVDNKLFKDSVMTLLRNDILTKRQVQFTFIPPEFMCYMTYKTDDDGLPVSILDGTLFFAYLYISSIVSSAMIKLLKSSDKEKYEIDVGLQKNANYSITEFQKVLSTRSLYSDGMFGSLSSVIKNAGSYQRLVIPVIKDKKLYDVTQMERYNNLDPDDSYTKDLLQSILSGIYINSGSFSEFDSADFAKQLTQRQLEYRNNIVDAQNNYFPNFITKQVRILTAYSTNDTYNSKAEILKGKSSKEVLNKIDISKINVKPSIPTYLSMTNIVENVNQAKDVASTIAEVMDLNGGNETDNKILSSFKKKITENYVPILDWEKIEDILDVCKNEASETVIEQVKRNTIDEKVNQPIDENQDLNPTEVSGDGSSGGGGGDFGGGDMSGGSDDFGGGGGDDFGDMGF